MTGLDIGTYAFKAVDVQKKADCLTLIDFRIQKRRSDEPLGDSLKRFLESGRSGSKDVVISASGNFVLARAVAMPQMDESELESAARFEIEKVLPFSMEDAVLDYQVVSTIPGVKKTMVLIAAAKKAYIQNYADIINGAGFNVKAVDIDGIALTNAFLRASGRAEGKDEGAFALLNIGDSLSNIAIIHNGVPIVLRDINIAGGEFSEAIAKGCGVEKEEAYRLKHNPPSGKIEEISDVLRPALNKLFKEIRISIGYFENQTSKNITTIYLSGGSARLVGLREFFEDVLEIRVESWDPFGSIALGEGLSPSSLAGARDELAVCLGLALRDD
ncbi:MAG: type IV pilus assembly protein PilM [Candidatus Omnitrophica bacterium]|nr:type IV pilus assembly protein PilM [Candidatus Omnitrophota bacterium]